MKKWIVTGLSAISLVSVAASAQATSFVNGDFTQTTLSGSDKITNSNVTGWMGNGGYNFLGFSGTGYSSATALNPGDSSLFMWNSSAPTIPVGGGPGGRGDGNPGFGSFNGVPPAGGNYIAMDGGFQTQPVTQNITGLTVGAKYTVGFDVAYAQQWSFNGPTTQHLTVSLGGQSFTTPDYHLPSHTFSGWSPVSYTFTATSTAETLSFLAYGNLPVPPFVLVDGVTFTQATPLPAALPLFAAGLGLFGAVARRRRMAAAAI
jgi:hypothetical protein